MVITRRGVRTALQSRLVRLALFIAWMPALVLAFVISLWGLVERQSALVAEVEKAVENLPGNNYEFTQPIQMRTNELVAGIRSDLAVLLYGRDLDQLSALGARVA